jgi:hypothetical protein
MHIPKIFSTAISRDKLLFVVVITVFGAVIIDTSFIKVYPFIFNPFISNWRIIIFLCLSVVCMVGQFVILELIKRKTEAIRDNAELHLNAIHKIVSIAQYALTALFLFCIVEMVTTASYNVFILMGSVFISYSLSAGILVFLSKLFFSWSRGDKNVIVFSYGLAAILLAINSAITLAYVAVVLYDVPTYVRDHTGETSVPFIIRGSMAFYLRDAFVISSIASFVMSWIATVFLLQHYSRKLGSIRYWIIFAIPLAFFLTQFQPILQLSVVSPFYGLQPILFSAVYTLVFTFSKSAGGILFGIAFWSMARSVRNSRTLRSYLIFSAYGFILLFASSQAIVLVNRNYPPFALPSVLLVGLSSYLIFLGIYCSAISVAQDEKLRRSIRKSVTRESQLLGSIGLAHFEQQIQKRVTKLSNEYQEQLTQQTGFEPSFDVKEYLQSVIEEVSKTRESKDIN